MNDTWQRADRRMTGAEWCEYYGIDRSTADFIVPNIDAAILAQIESNPKMFSMGSWHGDEKCNAENWCGTTHCRAGFAICLAGEPGFALRNKYGNEVAGRIIYAASRPDLPLPNFHATDRAALADLRAAAGRSG